VGRKIDVDDLIDSAGVAELLGLGNATSVSVYQARYPDMPRPLLHGRNGRCNYWSRTDIERWARTRVVEQRDA
jgi:glutathione-regulated potassium-efflux system ancillary protein KefG